MATIAAAIQVRPLSSIFRTPSDAATPNYVSSSSSLPLSIRIPNLANRGLSKSFKHPMVKFPSGLGKIRSVAEETLAPEEQNSAEVAASSADQPVSVPVSPSDKLVMCFQAEGTMRETAIPTITKALEDTEGVANLKVQLTEGIASVELKKQTTVQATGVASSLVEMIQGSGFKLQTLNLSFDDDEETVS